MGVGEREGEHVIPAPAAEACGRCRGGAEARAARDAGAAALAPRLAGSAHVCLMSSPRGAAACCTGPGAAHRSAALHANARGPAAPAAPPTAPGATARCTTCSTAESCQKSCLTRHVVPQLVNELVHLEGSRQRLNQAGGLDGAWGEGQEGRGSQGSGVAGPGWGEWGRKTVAGKRVLATPPFKAGRAACHRGTHLLTCLPARPARNRKGERCMRHMPTLRRAAARPSCWPPRQAQPTVGDAQRLLCIHEDLVPQPALQVALKRGVASGVRG